MSTYFDTANQNYPCGTLDSDFDFPSVPEGAVCATPDCGDEPDEGIELCQACIRLASRTVKHEWAIQYQ